MAARTLASRLRRSQPETALLILAIALTQPAGCEKYSCDRDGLHADFDTNCQAYYRCSARSVTGRYACSSGRIFSEALGSCVPADRSVCIQRTCAPSDQLAYSMPGTACRNYYRCANGSVIDHLCPFGTWFDFARQACTRGAATCFEPICIGLPTGQYPDVSHDCHREIGCRGAMIGSLRSCDGPCSADCPPPRSSSVPLPVGDADFCSDATCASLCQQVEDGAHAVRSTGCREYFVCEAGRVTRRGVCEGGMLFSGAACEPAVRVRCPAPGRSPCFNRPDGSHRDWRDCSSWFECQRERVASRGRCATSEVFDGAGCVQAADFPCEGPAPASECEGRPSGTYQDLRSNCSRYFHCEGALRTRLACPAGQVFDGTRCAPVGSYLCPSLERESCYQRPDGKYRALGTGCRGYYACANGEKAVYACPAGQAFDGERCVRAKPGDCTRIDFSCSGLSDGYHADVESGCRRYFYCEGGDRLTTLSCLGGKIFDGRSCMDASQHICSSGETPQQASVKSCDRDGFYVQPGSQCRGYYFCIMGHSTYLTCPHDQVFNGQVCVQRTRYSCPG